MRKRLAYLVLALLPALAAGGVYRWVDEDGTVHFSDTPQPGAEEVHVPPPQTYTPAPLPPATPPPQVTEVPKEYSALTITKPEPEANIWENTGAVAVSLSVEPPLNTGRGHKLVVLLDGQPAVTTKEAGATLEDVQRGSHSVQAQVVNAAGDVLVTSDPITIHVHRQSVLLPQRARPQPR